MPPTGLHLPLSVPLPPPSPPSSPPTATVALSPSAKVGSLSPPSPSWEDIPRSFMSDSPPPDELLPTSPASVTVSDNVTPVPTSTSSGPPVLRITVPEKTIPAEPELDEFVDPAAAEGLYFDDESLSKLERIYLFSRSRTVFHRIFISRTLTSYLPEVSPSDAVEYVLPLLNGLGTDPDEAVKEAFVAELVSIMMWFYTNCQVVDDDVADTPSDPPLLPVQAFTPLLGSLLLSQNGLISQTARVGVVDLLGRFNSSESDSERFGPAERKLLEQELIIGVVIGMARLDLPDDELYPQPSADPPISMESTRPENDSSQTTATVPTSPLDVAPALEPPSPYLTDADVFQDSDAHDPFSSWVPPSPNPGSEPSFDQAAFPEEDDGWLRAEVGESMFEDHDAGEEATLGRVASMSLIAAVTANGLANDETQKIFIEELKRVGRDPVYWVRREAAFALGALAKVVPFEIVLSTLVPLFESFVHDTVWHVRNSVLYALPPVLARLKQDHRRTVALNTLSLLASDPSQTVRSGLLEVLGEAIHEFRDDEGGPPTELIQLFIGEESAKWHAHEQQLKEKHGEEDRPWLLNSSPGAGFLSQPLTGATGSRQHMRTGSGDSGTFSAMFASSSSLIGADSGFIRDPERALICAFNIPAVTLTLRPDRWNELRDYYHYLASDRAPKVRRTLAASLGAMAKILGPDNARRDLIDMFWDAIRANESDVRHRAVDCLAEFLEALGTGERVEIEKGLEDIWTHDLKGWRERETFSKILPGIARCLDMGGKVARMILMKALLDDVAAVREAAISVVPAVSKVYEGRDTVLRALRQDLDSLASADKYRRRATFVACTLALLNDEELGLMEVKRTGLWERLAVLKDDPIVDVRIGVSRTIGVVCEKFYPDASTRPPSVSNLVMHLGKDMSMEVRSYVIFLLSPGSPPTSTTPLHTPTIQRFATFSRPPHHQTSFFEPPSPFELDSFHAHSPFLETDTDPFSHHPPPLDEPLVVTDSGNAAAVTVEGNFMAATVHSSFIDNDNDSDDDLEGEIDLDDVDDSDDDSMTDETSTGVFPLPPLASSGEVSEDAALNQAGVVPEVKPPISEDPSPLPMDQGPPSTVQAPETDSVRQGGALRDLPPHQTGLGLSTFQPKPSVAQQPGLIEPANRPPHDSQGTDQTEGAEQKAPSIPIPRKDGPFQDVQPILPKVEKTEMAAPTTRLTDSTTTALPDPRPPFKPAHSEHEEANLPPTETDPSTVNVRGSASSSFQVGAPPRAEPHSSGGRVVSSMDWSQDSRLLVPRIRDATVLKLSPPPKGKQTETATRPSSSHTPVGNVDLNMEKQLLPSEAAKEPAQDPLEHLASQPAPATIAKPQIASVDYWPGIQSSSIARSAPTQARPTEAETPGSLSQTEQTAPLVPSSPEMQSSPTLPASSVFQYSPITRSFQQPPLKGALAQPVLVEHHAANIPLPSSPSDDYLQFEVRTPSSASPAPSSQDDSIFSPASLPIDLRSPTPEDSPTLTTPPPNGQADGQDLSDDDGVGFMGKDGGFQVPEEDVYPTPTLEHPFYPGLGLPSKPHPPSRAQNSVFSTPETSGRFMVQMPLDPSPSDSSMEDDRRFADGEVNQASISRTFQHEDEGGEEDPFNAFVAQRKSDKTIVRAIA